MLFAIGLGIVLFSVVAYGLYNEKQDFSDKEKFGIKNRIAQLKTWQANSKDKVFKEACAREIAALSASL